MKTTTLILICVVAIALASLPLTGCNPQHGPCGCVNRRAALDCERHPSGGPEPAAAPENSEPAPGDAEM